MAESHAENVSTPSEQDTERLPQRTLSGLADLWDHRNASLREWLVNDFLLGPTGLGNGNVSGFYLDDNWHNTTQPNASWQPPLGFCDHSPIGGPSEENFWCVADAGLAQADTTALTDGWKATMDVVTTTLLDAGSWAWAFFSNWSPPLSSTQACTAAMRSICTAGPAWPQYSDATMVQWTLNTTAQHPTSPLPQPALDLAFFLTVRGPHWWLGYGWVGCSVPYDFPEALNVDYGEPTGTCAETPAASGVFARTWTKAVSTVDCNTLEGSVTLLH